ncbi:EF hand [Trypanosoma grayi]|uniref:EF hand n=1 Tax=Trypanosoma grayi TaxID=71804 RepID=UPI0004F41A3C|nr:EF hand [Trypanosoma grayi]KEG10053.1 EF hand [Trypanosoma grayi]
MSCCKAANPPEALTCQVCLDSFQNPIQVFICGHIFCQACVEGAKTCPTCRGKIEYTKPPGYSILQAIKVLPVICTSCGWQGMREQSSGHRCGTKETHSIYSNYPQLSDAELHSRATNKAQTSIFEQPGSVPGIALASSSQPTSGGAAKRTYNKPR